MKMLRTEARSMAASSNKNTRNICHAEHPTKFKVEFELKGMARGQIPKNEVIHELLDNATYEYIALATHPKAPHRQCRDSPHRKNYKGNIICFKGESADGNVYVRLLQTAMACFLGCSPLSSACGPCPRASRTDHRVQWRRRTASRRRPGDHVASPSRRGTPRYSGGRSLFGSFDKRSEPRASVNKGFAPWCQYWNPRSPRPGASHFVRYRIPAAFLIETPGRAGPRPYAGRARRRQL